MFNRILIPTDYSDTSRRALEVGLRIARTFGSEVVCMHVAEELQPRKFRSETIGEVSEMIDHDEEHLRAQATDRLAKLVADGNPGTTLDRVTFRVTGGTPYEEILELSLELRCDLIVIGTHGRSGLGDRLHGSTAERVMRKAQCSVMTVKPEGFPYLRERA